MSVASSSNQVIYTGSGTTGPFDFDFRVYKSSDLLVQKYTIASGILTDLTETTDYVVTLDIDYTGYVTTTSVVTSAYKLIITRSLPITQEITYVENDKFPSTSHEEGLDRGIMIDQQLQEQLDRCVKVTPGSTTDPDVLIEGLISAAADAEQAALDAQAAQTAAEAAQGLAETARTAAETAQGLAEDAQDAAEAAAAQAAQSVPVIQTGDANKVIAVKTDETGYELVEQGGGASATELTFTNSDLSTGVLTVTHNLGLASAYSVMVQVINNSGAVIIPDQINTFAANSFKVDLTSYGTISGTWSCIYVAKG